MIKLSKLPTVSLFIGLPGSGKTSIAAAFVRQAKRKKIPVYSNVPILGAYAFERSDIGSYAMGGVIIIDEAGLEFDNRDFDKNFRGESGKKMLSFFKLARHYGVKIIVLSQTADIDLKIRSLAGVIYLVKRSLILGCSVFYRVRRSIGITEDGHSLCDVFVEPKPLGKIFSSRLFRPRVYRYFDSYEAPPLPCKDFEPWASTSR